MIKRILKFFGLALYSQVRQQEGMLWTLERAYRNLRREHAQTEQRLWVRYTERLKNDLHMSLSWMYSEHVRRCSMGVPSVTVAQEQWPYYAKAMQLEEPPVIKPEKL